MNGPDRRRVVKMLTRFANDIDPLDLAPCEVSEFLEYLTRALERVLEERNRRIL